MSKRSLLHGGSLLFRQYGQYTVYCITLRADLVVLFCGFCTAAKGTGRPCDPSLAVLYIQRMRMMAFTVPPPTEPTTVAYRPLVVPVTVSLSPSSVNCPLMLKLVELSVGSQESS